MSDSQQPGDHQYEKTLRWWDGFTISLSIPAALFISMGYAIGAIGALPAIILSGAVAVFALLQNIIYSEMASMFPDKVGGIAMYANQGWKSRFTLVGPIAAYGYWFAWSSALAIYGLQIGSLVQAQWFPDQTWTVSTGTVDVGLPHLIAVGVLLAGWALNVLGIRPAMWIMYLTGVLVLIPIVLFSAAPLLGKGWDVSQITSDWSGGGFPIWQVIIAWAFIQAWAVYGIEAVATFVPEFRDTIRDSKIALRLAGVFAVAVYVLVPLGVGGIVDKASVAKDPVAFYVSAFEHLLGGAGWFMTVCIIAGLVLLMVMTTADGGRVLHGSAIDGLTVRQIGKVNRFRVPGRAMSLDLVVNVILILFVGSTLAVIIAGIIGIIFCHVLALSGYVLLRRDGVAPNRGIKLSPRWTVVAAVLALINVAILIIGVLKADITGYGSTRELIIGVGVLSLSVVLYVYRRVVQDKLPFVLRALSAPSETVTEPEPSSQKPVA
ncbi:hypothetical protein Aple_103310 [Acrocarpospora pleiomorpha]|uniref:Amino acid transporter n=1 Tax=Acrocarpospora pleiomorpha TaxID=90975 RepID=A0A5M3Y5N4_9ACTN|nr:APC family permease [Acrocarpospora pleiomorpha]GES27431.1 hypothetical protein Aple_103310 [Acrocarpospora pleiomorpha]